MRTIRLMTAVFCMLLAVGCASTKTASNPDDPFESYNRSMQSLNDTLDENALKPIANGYRKVVPQFARTGISNAFANLVAPWETFNHLLQFEPKKALETATRFLVNTTWGLGGVLDIASEMQIPRQSTDANQTLGAWGAPSGPYIVLPLLGPSTVRDATGRILSLPVDPLNRVGDVGTQIVLQSMRVVDIRANLLAITDTVDDAALDRYTFIRDAYMQMVKAQDRKRKGLDDSQEDEKPPKEERYDLEPATAPSNDAPTAPQLPQTKP